MTSKAVFLDRDGTICDDVHYLSSIDQIRILPGVDEAITRLNEKGFKVIIITNQSGVERGYLTLKDLVEINDFIISDLEKKGATVDAIYFCPHHPDSGCSCRKPAIGLLDRAQRDYDLDLASSFMVGDKMIDVRTGKNAGCKTVLVKTGYGEREIMGCEDPDKYADHIAEDLYDAALWIIETDEASEAN